MRLKDRILDSLRARLWSFLGIGRLRESINDAHNGVEALGKRLEQASLIGFDVSFAEPTQIIIVTKVDGGRVRTISTRLANMREIDALAQGLAEQFGIPEREIVWDTPRGQAHPFGASPKEIASRNASLRKYGIY